MKRESDEAIPVFGHLGFVERVVQPANFVYVQSWSFFMSKRRCQGLLLILMRRSTR